MTNQQNFCEREITIHEPDVLDVLAHEIFFKLDNDLEKIKLFAILLLEYTEATEEYREWR